jgi:hypothetical protein
VGSMQRLHLTSARRRPTPPPGRARRRDRRAGGLAALLIAPPARARCPTPRVDPRATRRRSLLATWAAPPTAPPIAAPRPALRAMAARIAANACRHRDRLHRPPPSSAPSCASRSQPPQPGRHGDRDGRDHGDDDRGPRSNGAGVYGR